MIAIPYRISFRLILRARPFERDLIYASATQRRNDKARKLTSVSGFIQPTAGIGSQLIILAESPGKDNVYHLYSSLSRGSAKHHFFQLGFYSNSYFTSDGELIHRLTHQPRRPVLLLVWFFTSDLSGKGGLTSGYATAGIALRLLRTHKLLYLQQAGSTSRINLLLLILLSPPQSGSNKIANCLNFSSRDFLAIINIYKAPYI